jgi:putative glutamine amidotransferase
MRRPVVGIPPGTDASGRWGAGREYHYIHAAYAAAVARAGATVLYLPVQDGVDALVEQIDGLLIPGGDDLPPPQPYPVPVPLELVPPRQLAFDRALLGAALARELPVLGICYGAQLLALQCGGRLHHYLPLDLPGAAPHKLGGADSRHALVLDRSSRLAAILEPPPPAVNSRHHQGIAEPGCGMRVSARAPDGVIEAIERADGAFCIGVQWHPETLDDPSGPQLFAAFAAACRARTR